jgi:hypothetical protein
MELRVCLGSMRNVLASPSNNSSTLYDLPFSPIDLSCDGHLRFGVAPEISGVVTKIHHEIDTIVVGGRLAMLRASRQALMIFPSPTCSRMRVQFFPTSALADALCHD